MKIKRMLSALLCICIMLTATVVNAVAMADLPHRPETEAMNTELQKSTALQSNNRVLVIVNGKKMSTNVNDARVSGKKYLANAAKLAKSFKASCIRRGKKLTIKKGVRLQFTKGKKTYTAAGKKRKSDIAANVYGQKFFVSIRTVAKHLNYKYVNLNKESHILYVFKTKAAAEKYFKSEVQITPVPTTGIDPENTDGTADPANSGNPNDPANPTATPSVGPSGGTNPGGTNPDNSPTPGVGETIAPTDKYAVIMEKNMDGGSFFSNTSGETQKVTPGANGSAGAMKLLAGTYGSYSAAPPLLNGVTYYVRMFVKGRILGIYAGDNKTNPTLDLSGTNYSDWTEVKAKVVGGVDVAEKLSVKVVCASDGDGYIDEFQLIRFAPAGEGSDENYANPLTRIRIDAPNFYKIGVYSMKDEKLDATVCIDDGSTEHKVIVPKSKIILEGRGNSTFFGIPKKPLKFKFVDGKQPIGDLPAGKKWNLMADYYDRTMMRNALMQNFASHLPGLDYATRTKFTEVYINEEYVGVYLLTEAISVSPDRVNIDNDPAKENFGFMVEWDMRAPDEAEGRYNNIEDKTNISSKEDTYFPVKINDATCYFVYKSPDAENMTSTQRTYIKDYITNASDKLVNANNSEDYLQVCDVDSFVDFFIVNDFAQNSDSISFASIYMHKDKDGKLKMGPCWDFDIYVGNGKDAPYSKCLEWGSPWFNPLLGSQTFRSKLSNRWDEIKNTVAKDELVNIVDTWRTQLASAAERNFTKWDTQTNTIFVGNMNRPLKGSWSAEVDYLKSWLEERWTYADGYY